MPIFLVGHESCGLMRERCLPAICQKYHIVSTRYYLFEPGGCISKRDWPGQDKLVLFIIWGKLTTVGKWGAQSPHIERKRVIECTRPCYRSLGILFLTPDPNHHADGYQAGAGIRASFFFSLSPPAGGMWAVMCDVSNYVILPQRKCDEWWDGFALRRLLFGPCYYSV